MTVAAADLDAAHVARLACPDDRALLVAAPPDAVGAPAGGDVALRCPRCGRDFPAPGGIPRLLPRELEAARAAAAAAAPAATAGAGGATAPVPAGTLAPGDPTVALRLAEAAVRDAESGVYDEIYADAEYRHELATYVRLLDPQPGDAVLDLGAGTGRVTKEFAARPACVVAADFSRASLERLVARPDLRARDLLAVEADATALPFADAAFDRAAVLSLVCFLPSDALRARLVAELARVLRPGGTLVLSTYHYALVKRLWAALGRSEGALREGFQSAGRVYYRNQTVAELRALLAPAFDMREVRGVCHRVPFVSNLGPGVSRALDGLLGRTRLAIPVFATEVVARAVRR